MKAYVLKKLFICSVSLSAALSALAWGQKGHDVTAYIAEQHFTPATAEAVAVLLDGMSPVYWANWLDNASHTPEYAYTKTWHYKNVDADKTYWTQPEQAGGDIVMALRQIWVPWCKAGLKSALSSKRARMSRSSRLRL